MPDVFRDHPQSDAFDDAWARLRRSLFNRWAYVTTWWLLVALFGGCVAVYGASWPVVIFYAALVALCVQRAAKARSGGACPHCGKPFWSGIAATAVGARCAHCRVPFGAPMSAMHEEPARLCEEPARFHGDGYEDEPAALYEKESHGR